MSFREWAQSLDKAGKEKSGIKSKEKQAGAKGAPELEKGPAEVSSNPQPS